MAYFVFACAACAALRTPRKIRTQLKSTVPFVLFAYRSSLQESTKDSPFHLLYGWEQRSPTNAVTEAPMNRRLVDSDDYNHLIFEVHVWSLGGSWHKLMSDRLRTTRTLCTIDVPVLCSILQEIVFVHMPSTKQGKAYKFPRTFHDHTRSWRVEWFSIGLIVCLKNWFESLKMEFKYSCN